MDGFVPVHGRLIENHGVASPGNEAGGSAGGGIVRPVGAGGPECGGGGVPIIGRRLRLGQRLESEEGGDGPDEDACGFFLRWSFNRWVAESGVGGAEAGLHKRMGTGGCLVFGDLIIPKTTFTLTTSNDYFTSAKLLT